MCESRKNLRIDVVVVVVVVAGVGIVTGFCCYKEERERGKLGAKY